MPPEGTYMPLTQLSSRNENGRDWTLLTPAEWIQQGFEIRFAEGEPIAQDSEIEELIEEFSDQQHGIPPYPKTAYRSLELDTHRGKATLHIVNADWKRYMGTSENPKFFDLMRRRFNKAHNSTHSLDKLLGTADFHQLVSQYCVNALAHAHAVVRGNEIDVGERSEDVDVEKGTWHVYGGTFQAVGTSIYKSPVPLLNGVPVTNTEKFGSTPDSLTESHLRAHAICNVYDETGRTFAPRPEDVQYTGIVFQPSTNNVELIGMITGEAGGGTKDWEHKKIIRVPLEEIPSFASEHLMVPTGQAALVSAYILQKGLDSLGNFPFVERKAFNTAAPHIKS